MVKNIFFFILIKTIFFISFQSLSFELKIIASVNNEIITNYDFFIEKQNFELLNNQKIDDSKNKSILQNIINEKIKMLEIKNKNIVINNDELNNKFSILKSQKLNNINLNKENEKYIKNNIKNNIGWNKLIYQTYKNKLSINMVEIDNMLKKENFKNFSREKVIEIEQNKKLNILSRTYFNEIKRNYFIKIF